jgi:uncharacterized membrane protein
VLPVRRQRYANERLVVLAGLGIATALCVALEVLRELHYHTHAYRFLLWNLTLAWIPLLLGLLIYDRYRRGAALLELAPVVALWLLFLPNAPYILTDFIHLSPTPGTPLWLDGAILSAFAWTGILLGFVSLYLVHGVARDRYGGRVGWSSVTVVLALVSAGVCLGRFMRWNSWDMLFQPGKRLAELTPHLSDPSAVAEATAATLVLTFLLAAAYACFYMLLRVRLEPRSNHRHN